MSKNVFLIYKKPTGLEFGINDGLKRTDLLDYAVPRQFVLKSPNSCYIKYMNIYKTIKESPTKKILLVITCVIVLPVVGFFVSIPIFDKLDQDRFATLDTQIKSIFQNLQSTSGETDAWQYETACSTIMSGWMATGTYDCSTLISFEKAITSVQEVNSLQAKYYPAINDSDNLNQKTDLDLQLPNDFGKKFVVSSAEKRFTEVKSGIECRYLIKLDQDKSNENTKNSTYGSKIDNSLGNLRISLRCSETARSDWYQLAR